MASPILDGVGIALVLVGTGFFTAGTIGLIRFPDVRTRLHALTKADNLGLGLLLGGVALIIADLRVAGLLALVWLFALAAASVSAHLIASLHDHDGPESADSNLAGESADRSGRLG